MSFAATSHNSWFHCLQATTRRYTCGIILLQTTIVTLGGVLNTNHNSYSRHKISNTIGHNLWLTNQVETLHMSHNSHTHTGYQYQQAITQDRHVFTLHSEPQLKECHFEPQLKECFNRFHTWGTILSVIDHAPKSLKQLHVPCIIAWCCLSAAKQKSVAPRTSGSLCFCSYRLAV